MVLVHEQDALKGACPFRTFFEQTPVELQKKYRLYDTLAVPLYPSAEHRTVSLRYALRNMGATQSRQAKVGMRTRVLRLGSALKSIKLECSACWRHDPLVHEFEASEEGTLELTGRSVVRTSVAAVDRSQMSTPRFHFEKRASRPNSLSQQVVARSGM